MIVASLNWRHEWHPEVFFYRLLIFSLYDAPNETNLVITFEIMLNWKLFLGLFLILLKYIRKYLRMKFERTFQCVKCTSKFVEIINSNIFHAQLIQANRFVCVGLFQLLLHFPLYSYALIPQCRVMIRLGVLWSSSNRRTIGMVSDQF